MHISLILCLAFRLATWNVGHWSNGAHSTSTIEPGEEESRKAAQYQAKLEAIDADWFGAAEYSSNFVARGSADASERVFKRYPCRQVGPVHNYQWNAVFHSPRFQVLESKVEYYPVHHQKTYAYAHRVLVDGAYEAWFVQTHLDFIKPEIRTAEIAWLVEHYGKKDRVVIAGDFNTKDSFSEYDIFSNAGFNVLNTRLPTMGKGIRDNIIVKGFKASDLTLIPKEKLSDHNGLVVTLEPTGL